MCSVHACRSSSFRYSAAQKLSLSLFPLALARHYFCSVTRTADDTCCLFGPGLRGLLAASLYMYNGDSPLFIPECTQLPTRDKHLLLGRLWLPFTFSIAMTCAEFCSNDSWHPLVFHISQHRSHRLVFFHLQKWPPSNSHPSPSGKLGLV